MIKIQFLPLLPFIALSAVLLLAKFPKLENLSHKISSLFALLFLITTFAFKKNFSPDSINLVSFTNQMNLAFIFEPQQTLLLLLLGCFWFFGAVYCRQYFVVSEEKKSWQFDVFFLLVIGLITLILLAKNLLTILLFYQILSLILYFSASKFVNKNSKKSLQNFGYFITATSSFLFIALVLTFKFTGKIDFIEGGIFTKIEVWQFSLLLICYIFALALLAFAPLYLLFANLYYLAAPLLILLLIAFGLTSAFLLMKVLGYIFGIKFFAIMMAKINSYNLINSVFALNLFICSLLAILSKNLKQIVVFLFFNQLIIIATLFLTLGLAIWQMQMIIVSLALSQLIIFCAIGNISLYLSASKDKTLNGIFYKLPITILSLIFALLNIIGLAPGLAMVEKYWWIKKIISNDLWSLGLLLVLNLFFCLIILIKIIYPMIEISSKNNHPENYPIAKNIEWNLGLMLPALILPVILFFLAFPFVSNFFIKN